MVKGFRASKYKNCPGSWLLSREFIEILNLIINNYYLTSNACYKYMDMFKKYSKKGFLAIT